MPFLEVITFYLSYSEINGKKMISMVSMISEIKQVSCITL